MRSNEEIVNIIVELKNEKGMSLSELARNVDMAKSALSRYFNKKRQFPLNRVNDFAKVLGVTPEYILGFESPQKTNVDFLGKYIKYLRLKRNVSKEDLGVLTGFSTETISNHEDGTGLLTEEDVNKYADAFKVPHDTFLKLAFADANTVDEKLKLNTLKLIVETSEELNEERQLIVLSFAKKQLKEQENPEQKVISISGKTAANPSVLEYGDFDIEQQAFAHVPKGADCATHIQGDSMEPLIKDGSIIFYKHQEDVESGEIAIVEINGDGVTCKRVIKDYDSQKIILRSENERYEDMVINDENVRIIGKVILQ